jgi:hypothetical protein
LNTHVGPARYTYYGKTIHLCLSTLRDLDQVLKLDEVFWLATTAPISDFLLPPGFLERVDSDSDGRVRVQEVKAAIRWLRANSRLESPSDVLKREHLKSENLQTAWDKIVKAFGLEQNVSWTYAELQKLRFRYIDDPMAFGAGSLAPDEVKDEAHRALLEAVAESVKPEREAVTEEQLDSFLAAARVSLDWREESPGENHWADEYPVFYALREPLRHYFETADTCRYVGQQPEMKWPDGDLDLGDMPLVWPLQADGVPFENRVNPLYKEQVKAFRNTFLQPGEAFLAREYYEELRDRFETYSEWLERSPGTIVKNISTEELSGWLEDSELMEQVRKKLRDKRQRGLVRQDFLDLEQLLLYQTHMLNFCQNFVAFPDLYNPRSRALFERGTLIMDGREFHLSLPVSDINSHKAASARSNMFVLYAQVDEEVYAIPVTSGSKGNLSKSKRGVFHHVDGTEREVTVIDIVSNPISLWEALLAPFEKIGTAFKRRIEAMSAEGEDRLLAETAKPTKPEKTSGSMLAGGGIAVAAMGSSLAFVVKTLASLTVPSILLGLVGLLILCLAPAALVAYLKLRSRDLSAVLEGNAWGINARMRLTPIQARQFTQRPRHPGFVGSSMSWILVIGMIVLAGCLAYFFRDTLFILFSG